MVGKDRARNGLCLSHLYITRARVAVAKKRSAPDSEKQRSTLYYCDISPPDELVCPKR
jgi:hypothetical protein